MSVGRRRFARQLGRSAGRSWLARWLGIAAVPLAVGGVCLYFAFVPYPKGPEIHDAPTVEGVAGTVRCPPLSNDAAWTAIEGSTNPRDQVCLDAREDEESFRSMLTLAGAGSIGLGVLVLVVTLVVRSGREHRLLEAELARRRAEQAGSPIDPPSPLS